MATSCFFLIKIYLLNLSSFHTPCWCNAGALTLYWCQSNVCIYYVRKKTTTPKRLYRKDSMNFKRKLINNCVDLIILKLYLEVVAMTRDNTGSLTRWTRRTLRWTCASVRRRLFAERATPRRRRQRLKVRQRRDSRYSNISCVSSPGSGVRRVPWRVSGNSSVGLPYGAFTLAARAPKSAYQVRTAVTSLRAPPQATTALSFFLLGSDRRPLCRWPNQKLGTNRFDFDH